MLRVSKVAGRDYRNTSILDEFWRLSKCGIFLEETNCFVTWLVSLEHS